MSAKTVHRLAASYGYPRDLSCVYIKQIPHINQNEREDLHMPSFSENFEIALQRDPILPVRERCTMSYRLYSMIKAQLVNFKNCLRMESADRRTNEAILLFTGNDALLQTVEVLSAWQWVYENLRRTQRRKQLRTWRL